MGGLFTPPDSPDAYVWGMWVEPTSRGRGVADRLLRRLLELAEAEGRSVVLDVTEGNEAAGRLYEKHGFVPTGEREPLRDGSEIHVVIMRKA